MVNFILADDQELFLDYLEKMIRSIMQFKNINYKIHRFLEYDEQFYNIVKSKLPNKFYFLDIVTPKSNGIDASRKIRALDKESEILFMTIRDDNQEFMNYVVRSDIKSLGFLYKGELEEFLLEKIDYVIAKINEQMMIALEDTQSTYLLYLNEINYITTSKNSRKVSIDTLEKKVEIRKSFTELENLFSKTGEMIKTHRSCLVNPLQIHSINWKESSITFHNNKKIYLLSRQYKKALREQFTKQIKETKLGMINKKKKKKNSQKQKEPIV